MDDRTGDRQLEDTLVILSLRKIRNLSASDGYGSFVVPPQDDNYFKIQPQRSRVIRFCSGDGPIAGGNFSFHSHGRVASMMRRLLSMVCARY